MMRATQKPTRGHGDGSPCVIDGRLSAIETDDGECAAGPEEVAEPGQRASERKMMQRRDGGDEIEAVLGEWVGEDVSFDEGDCCFCV